MFFRRKRPQPLAQLNEFGFGPFHVTYQEKSIPGDQSSLRYVYLGEQLPIEQVVGPAFVNASQNQTVRRDGEVAAAVQGLGFLQVQANGIDTGTLYNAPLTDINSVPGGIPIIANGPPNSFVNPLGA